jgi:poly(3-hydroxybutyrate) depolymerase
MMHRGERVDPSRIRSVALLTVEGEHDDISGVGQTESAHRLCSGIPAERRAHHLQRGVGHYGVFNGSRFRAEIAPRISDFIATHAPHRPNGAVRVNGNGASATVALAGDKPAASKRSRGAKVSAKTAV